jgi:chemotaxis protein CheX
MNPEHAAGTTMEPLKEPACASGQHEKWLPLMELATREVFEMMMGCQLALAELAVDGCCDTTSIVGLAGKLCGTMTVACAAKSATLMASKMLGIDAVDGSSDVSDALGEVCNMVAGNFKNKIPGLGDGCLLSVPIVITGKNYSTHCVASSAVLDLNLLFEGKPFLIRLRIRG